MAIADVFDALISVRSYKPAYSVEESLKIMETEDGRQFDPELMKAFRKALPDILRIKENYADEYGALTDLEMLKASQ